MFEKLPLKIFIFSFLAYSNIVFAKNSYLTDVFDWRTSGGNYYSSTTFLTPIDLSKESYFITSEIGLNMDGLKKLYFNIYKMAGNGRGAIDMCNKNDYEKSGDTFVTDKIWSFNGQNIKMVVFCIPDSVDGRLYMQATPRTYEGHNFIKEALISESKNIIVDSNILKFEISPRGFSKRWRASSNAL